MNPELEKILADAPPQIKRMSPEMQQRWAERQFEIRSRPVVPVSVTPRQCRLVLMSQGLLQTVEAMISLQDEATRITWEFALEFRRDDPLLNQLAQNLELTNKQIDEFFIAASSL